MTTDDFAHSNIDYVAEALHNAINQLTSCIHRLAWRIEVLESDARDEEPANGDDPGPTTSWYYAPYRRPEHGLTHPPLTGSTSESWRYGPYRDGSTLSTGQIDRVNCGTTSTSPNRRPLLDELSGAEKCPSCGNPV